MFIKQRQIARALESGEFRPHFQPLVDLRTGNLQGFELLARWKDHDGGWIPPAVFIPLAEKDGWIDHLTKLLIQEAFSTMVRLDIMTTLSVNISPVQLRSLELPTDIEKIAKANHFPLDRLIIEITESALAEDIERAQLIMAALKDMGCKLALDDFGTGYSSLANLQSLPFDELKVDQSFVSSMVDRRGCRKIVAAVVGLGQSLGLRTVAEGVETIEQAQMLRWLGCDIAQGWLYGKPVPGENLVTALSAFPAKEPSCQTVEDVGRVWRGLDLLPALRLGQLQAVYDGAPVGLAFLDRDLRYKMLNRRLAEMNGRPMVDHVGRAVSEMIPEMLPFVQGYLRRALDGEAIHGAAVTRPASDVSESKELMVSYEPIRDEAGEVAGVSIAVVDLSPIKHAEEARSEAEKHFRQMIELLPQIPWIIDPEGRALDVSQRWLQISGMKGDEWKGFGWLTALHPDDLKPTWDAMNSSFKSGKPIDLVYRVRSAKDAPWESLRSRGAANIGVDGEITCWYGCLEAVQ